MVKRGESGKTKRKRSYEMGDRSVSLGEVDETGGKVMLTAQVGGNKSDPRKVSVI